MPRPVTPARTRSRAKRPGDEMRGKLLARAEQAVRDGLERGELQVRQRQARPVRPITKTKPPARSVLDLAPSSSAPVRRPRAKKT